MSRVIPPHLREHVARQHYRLYTAIDHASWRYVMRVSKVFFKKHAHKKYIQGLEQTGITTERIPRITEMDKKLKKFGWSAVTVTGFIPPAVFLEFQSLSILPIACDMRRLEHLDYTPSPDIVHEAAGHAPIISDPKYASYLHKFGEIARKAIFAKEDLKVYEAIKYLSDIKENPETKPQEVEVAYQRLHEAYKKVPYVSEATKLSRLGWWTIEYGLVKTSESFKIYGAGLLSSLGESYSAIMKNVKRLPLTIDCVNTDYDITTQQPQLFYVGDLTELASVIDELASTMAYKLGGVKALEVGKRAETVTTTWLDSGLQIGGILVDFHLDAQGQPCYLQWSGPSQLAYADSELKGHSAKYHKQGFGTPIGLLKKIKKSPAELSINDMKTLGLKKGSFAELEFASGVTVSGKFVSSVKKQNKNIIFTFKNCQVKWRDKILFDPAWGNFDMACGEKVVSVFGGAPDRGAYLRVTQKTKFKVKNQVTNLTAADRPLVPLYASVRTLRERRAKVGLSSSDLKKLIRIYEKLTKNFSSDWLLRLEILELLKDIDNEKLKMSLRKDLFRLSKKSRVLASLIHRGLELMGGANQRNS